LRIFQVLGDGNCLFRSVAHQAYGNNELHWLVRQKCMDYMEADADFFSQFIEGGRESFALYLRAKRRDACWGDDPEIQAISEIYHRPVEIWAYDPHLGARKLRTFHEAASMEAVRAAGSRACPPIRLSYYGGGHYDSIIDDNFLSTIIQHRPGEVEDRALNLLKQRNALLNQSADITSGPLTSEAETRDREAINYTIEMSRKDLCWAEEDLESILVMSLEEEAKRLGIPRADLGSKDSAHDIVATQQQILSHVTASSENDYIEKAILSSLADDPNVAEAQLIEQAQRESMLDVESIAAATAIAHDADPELAAVIELSKLSEDEALEMALKQSMDQSNSSISASAIPPSSSSSTMNPQAMPSTAFLDDEDMLNAALAASLAESSYDYPTAYPASMYEINDDDEDISRAIAESLKRR
jgi:OTU domain-containing protein 5